MNTDMNKQVRRIVFTWTQVPIEWKKMLSTLKYSYLEAAVADDWSPDICKLYGYAEFKSGVRLSTILNRCCHNGLVFEIWTGTQLEARHRIMCVNFKVFEDGVRANQGVKNINDQTHTDNIRAINLKYEKEEEEKAKAYPNCLDNIELIEKLDEEYINTC